MRISFLSLILGLVIGILLIVIIYYGIYKAFNIYFKIRHPFSSSTDIVSESSIYTPPPKLSISEWMNKFDNEFIASGDVFIFDENDLSLSIDESRKYLKLTKFNSTDKMQKWKLFFFKDPNDPYEDTEGIIYNNSTNQYIFFLEDELKLVSLDSPYILNSPVGNFSVECIQSSNKISNPKKEFWLYADPKAKVLKTIKNKKNAMNFFVSVIKT